MVPSIEYDCATEPGDFGGSLQQMISLIHFLDKLAVDMSALLDPFSLHIKFSK